MRRRWGIDVLLAVLLPALCALAVLGLKPERAEQRRDPPARTPLTISTVVCPQALGAGGAADGVQVTVAGATGVRTGDIQVGPGTSVPPLRVRSGRVATAPAGAGPVVLTAEDDLAPGLLAGRSRTAPLAAVDCAEPVGDQWFTAVGAGPTHDSVVELFNPSSGPAVVDITVRGPGGIIDVPALRGVSVPGGTSSRLDLGQIAPRGGELALQVDTSRGRLGVHVVDSHQEIGAPTSVQDWLPAQAEPATTNVLLGLIDGTAERMLVLTNPGSEEVRATVEVVTPTSVFTPTGVDPVRIAPDATEAVPLDEVLAEATATGATGLLIESSAPVTAALRQLGATDVSVLAGAPALDEPTAAIVPSGTARLLLGPPEAPGAAVVTTYDARGRTLADERVELAPQTGSDLALPDGTALVSLRPEGTSVRAAVLASGTGTAAVPLRPLMFTGLVPAVRPGVP